MFSRYVVGWVVAHRESAELARRLISESIAKQGICRHQLTVHVDRGSSMTSKPVALLLSDLGVIKSHSRPDVSNDNPFSESHFKTLKYRPAFPDRWTQVEARQSIAEVDRAECRGIDAGDARLPLRSPTLKERSPVGPRHGHRAQPRSTVQVGHRG